MNRNRATSAVPAGRSRVRRPGRGWRIGALVFGLGACVSVGMSAAEAARTQRPASARIAPTAVGTGLQLTRPFNVEPATAATQREVARGTAALALVRLRVQDVFPGWTIAFRPARTGYLGMTMVKQRRVEIYVRLDRPLEGLAHDIAHEFGHVADVTFNNDDQRQAYLDLRDRSNSPWWTCNGCGDLQVGAGDFAETFALWAAPPFRFYSDFAPKPTDEDLRAFAALLSTPLLAAAAPTATPPSSTLPTFVAPNTTAGVLDPLTVAA